MSSLTDAPYTPAVEVTTTFETPNSWETSNTFTVAVTLISK